MSGADSFPDADPGTSSTPRLPYSRAALTRIHDSASPGVAGRKIGDEVNKRDPASWSWRLEDDAVAPLAFFSAMVALALTTPAQNDTWWHLRSGREMWESGSFLLTERFSHTAFGSELHNHWWLAQLLFYAAYAAGGPHLLTLLAGGCAFAAVWGSWMLLRGSFELQIVLLLFLVIATAAEWSIRPQVISLVLLVSMLHLTRRGRTAWFPLVCVVWANSHAMVVFGVLMACAAVAEAGLWSRDRIGRELVTLGLCVAAPTLSPLGVSYWPQIVSTIGASKVLGIHEYRTPIELGVADISFWAMVVALAAAAIYRRRELSRLERGDRITLIAAAGLALAGVSAARNIAFFAVAAAPALSALLSIGVESRSRRRRPAAWPAYAMLAVVTAGAIVFAVIRWGNGGAALGWAPISPAAIMAVDRCDGRLFNQMEDGGYLMWSLPARRVFIDSRMEAYPLEFLKRVRQAEHDGVYRALFDAYDVTCAIVMDGSPLFERLMVDSSMALVHRDQSRAVFARSHP